MITVFASNVDIHAFTYIITMGCTGLYRVVQGCTRLYRVVQGCTGLYRVVQVCTGLYRVVQGCITGLVIKVIYLQHLTACSFVLENVQRDSGVITGS